MPKRILRLGREYAVTAQLVDAVGRLGPPGQPTGFALDPLAAVVGPEPCAGPDCNSIFNELFRGPLGGGESTVLDASNLVPESEDWVSDLYLNIERTGGSGEALTIHAHDVELPAQPTVANLTGGATVRVSPSTDGKFVLHNPTSQAMSLSITAVTWTSGYTLKLQALDKAIETESDRLAEEERPATAEGLGVVVAQPQPSPPPACEEAGPHEVSCLGEAEFASGGAEFQIQDTAGSRTTAASAFASDIPSGGLDADCVENFNAWVYLSRTEACRVSLRYYNRLDTRSGKVVGSIYFFLFESVVFGRGDSEIDLTSRAYWHSPTLALEGQPLTLSHNIQCLPNVCTSRFSESARSRTISPTDRWSGHMASEAQVSLDPEQVLHVTGEDVISRLSAIVTRGNLGTQFLSGPPNFRCDRRAEVRFSVFGSPRTTGCVFHEVTPVFELNSLAYPKHAEMVEEGQDILYEHPGMLPTPWESTRPLTRIRAKGSGNRAVATRMCRKEKLAPSCDEYPYNSTRQGCSTGVATIPIVVRDVCVVRSVPLSQNTGAGASLLWFMRADRVLHDDDYYIVTTGGDDPGTQ